MNVNFQFNYRKDIPPDENAYWFIFRNEDILVLTDENATKPLLIEARIIPQLDIEKALHIGMLNSIQCYAIFDHSENEIEIPDTEWVPLRSSIGKFSYEMFQIYGRARQLLL